MPGILNDLDPKNVWSYFKEICEIPRPSKAEDKISEYIVEFAKNNNLDYKVDDIGNILISKPAVSGKENLKSVVLQSHMDMVGEKNSDIDHDFTKDPIVPVIDGDWFRAEGTTLGADDGIY